MKGSVPRMYKAESALGLQKPDSALPGPVRGVLSTPEGSEHGRLVPKTPRVAEFVEHFWWVRWNLERPHSAEVLTFPSVHVVFEGEGARVVGIVRAKFVRELVGRGEVFGVKFRPGMFRPLSDLPAYRLTGVEVPLGVELGEHSWDPLFRSVEQNEERARAIEEILAARLPDAPARALLARDLVERVRSDSEIRTAAMLADLGALRERALQRLFLEYVGVSPKWVVCRFRLQEAAGKLVSSQETIASVAHSLGYFDQAHFSREFKAVVGQTPQAFIAERRRV